MNDVTQILNVVIFIQTLLAGVTLGQVGYVKSAQIMLIVLQGLKDDAPELGAPSPGLRGGGGEQAPGPRDSVCHSAGADVDPVRAARTGRFQ